MHFIRLPYSDPKYWSRGAKKKKKKIRKYTLVDIENIEIKWRKEKKNYFIGNKFNNGDTFYGVCRTKNEMKLIS